MFWPLQSCGRHRQSILYDTRKVSGPFVANSALTLIHSHIQFICGMRIHIIVNPSLMYIVSTQNVHTLLLDIVLSILLFLVNSFSQIFQGSFCENLWIGGEPTKVKFNYIYPNVITFGPMYLHLQNCDPLSPKGANVITLKCNHIWPMTLTKCGYICQISNHAT